MNLTSPKIIVLVLFAGLIFRLFITPYGSFPIDFNDWIAWSNRLYEIDFSKFYEAWSDYLPGYLYVLWSLKHMLTFLNSINFNLPLEIIYKFPAIVGDLT
ncbi:MAG: hypothetical protein WD512_09980, partial [Candidatus Paceibacterota bacterium]